VKRPPSADIDRLVIEGRSFREIEGAVLCDEAIVSLVLGEEPAEDLPDCSSTMRKSAKSPVCVAIAHKRVRAACNL
jgi:hypothetical protein